MSITTKIRVVRIEEVWYQPPAQQQNTPQFITMAQNGDVQPVMPNTQRMVMAGVMFVGEFSGFNPFMMPIQLLPDNVKVGDECFIATTFDNSFYNFPEFIGSR